jgi:hypothetical protein
MFWQMMAWTSPVAAPMPIGVDFGITQVVHGNCVHAVIKKAIFGRRSLIRDVRLRGRP